jgi:hypothetical protein
MDLYRAIRELYEEKKRLDQAIEYLEELQRRQATAPLELKRRGRKSMDDDARREVSERMKKYWALRRRSRKTGPSS